MKEKNRQKIFHLLLIFYLLPESQYINNKLLKIRFTKITQLTLLIQTSKTTSKLKVFSKGLMNIINNQIFKILIKIIIKAMVTRSTTIFRSLSSTKKMSKQFNKHFQQFKHRQKSVKKLLMRGKNLELCHGLNRNLKRNLIRFEIS